MYTLCTHHSHHYNSELVQPGQGVTTNTYCTLVWCPHTHTHIQIDNHYQIEVHTKDNCTHYQTIMQAQQQNGLVTGSTVSYYSPHALAAWLHTLYTCHGTTLYMCTSCSRPLIGVYMLINLSILTGII